MRSTAMAKESATYPGESAFRLYDTFGLPRDFIEDACRDAGVIFRFCWFRLCHGGAAQARAGFLERRHESLRESCVSSAAQDRVFEGYVQTRSDNCEVLAIIKSRAKTGA